MRVAALAVILSSIIVTSINSAHGETFALPFNDLIDAPYEYDGHFSVLGNYADSSTQYVAQFSVTTPSFNLGPDPTMSGANNVFGFLGVGGGDGNEEGYFTIC